MLRQSLKNQVCDNKRIRFETVAAAAAADAIFYDFKISQNTLHKLNLDTIRQTDPWISGIPDSCIPDFWIARFPDGQKPVVGQNGNQFEKLL